MADMKKVRNVISIIWLVILITLWVTYSWLPWFDILTWMWIAIGWSFIGGVFGSIYFAAREKRNLLIVSIIWIVTLIILWLDWFLTFLPGQEVHWMWITIVWSLSCVIVALGIMTLKLLKKTQW